MLYESKFSSNFVHLRNCPHETKNRAKTWSESEKSAQNLSRLCVSSILGARSKIDRIYLDEISAKFALCILLRVKTNSVDPLWPISVTFGQLLFILGCFLVLGAIFVFLESSYSTLWAHFDYLNRFVCTLFPYI